MTQTLHIYWFSSPRDEEARKDVEARCPNCLGVVDTDPTLMGFLIILVDWCVGFFLAIGNGGCFHSSQKRHEEEKRYGFLVERESKRGKLVFRLLLDMDWFLCASENVNPTDLGISKFWLCWPVPKN